MSSQAVSSSDVSKGVKRPAEDEGNTDTPKKHETEVHTTLKSSPPDEGRPVFRLNPPTLIHGIAKPAPKTEEDEASSEVQEKPLLRPSLLQNHSGWSNPFLGKASTPDSTSEETPEKKKDDKENQEETDSKPPVNFLKLSTGDSDRGVGFGVFGTFTDSHLHKVDFSNDKKEAEKCSDKTQENYFLQFSKSTDPNEKDEASSENKEVSSSSSNTLASPSSEDFVFGQNMDSRVTSPPKPEGELHSAAQFVFGQNLSDRIKKEGEEDVKPKVESSPDQSGKSLKESAEEMEKARDNKRVKFEEVEVITGEEGEENVVQVPCKLHIFQTGKQNWEERGRGLLRLNDKTASGEISCLESRVILRAQGSLRLLLNAKVWPGMMVEKVTSRSIRISAMDGDTGNIKIYLITATPNDAEQIYQGLDYRVQALKKNQSETGIEGHEEVDESTKDSCSFVNEDSWPCKDEDEETSNTRDAT